MTSPLLSTSTVENAESTRLSKNFVDVNQLLLDINFLDAAFDNEELRLDFLNDTFLDGDSSSLSSSFDDRSLYYYHHHLMIVVSIIIII